MGLEARSIPTRFGGRSTVTSLRPVDYTDSEGRKRRALAADKPDEGIPLSMELDALFPDAPADFLSKLHNALWARGLIEPRDYLQPGAPEIYKRALLSVIRLDFATIKQVAQERLNHD